MYLIEGILNQMAMGSLVVLVSGFKPEGPGSIPDAAKDPPSACSLRAHKIYGSKSPMIGHYQFTMGENFPPFQRHIKIVEVEVDGVLL